MLLDVATQGGKKLVGVSSLSFDFASVGEHYSEGAWGSRLHCPRQVVVTAFKLLRALNFGRLVIYRDDVVGIDEFVGGNLDEAHRNRYRLERLRIDQERILARRPRFPAKESDPLGRQSTGSCADPENPRRVP